ncbi:MAG: TPM domain-containing protein [bacterium]
MDEVNLVNTEDHQLLEQKLVSLEAETHHQIGIAIIKSLQGRTIEEAGIAIARTW